MEDNHTYLLREYERDIIKMLVPVDIFLSIVLMVGIIGNIFVIFIFATKMRKDKKGARYFIPILAVSDLMVCIASEINTISESLHWTSFHSDMLCKTLMFFLLQTIMTSSAFLLAIAVQRFIKICRPTAKQMTLFWRRITIIFVIVANTSYSIPTAIVSGVQETSVVYNNISITGEGCSTGNNKYPRFQLIYGGILILIIVTNIVTTAGLYTPIALVIYRRFRKQYIQRTSIEETEIRRTSGKISVRIANGVASAQLTPQKPKRDRQSQTNFNVMFFVIIFIYLISYIPTAVVLIYVTMDDTMWATSSYGEIRSYFFLIRTYVFNHAANPFVYAYFDSEIKSHMMCLLFPRLDHSLDRHI